jgi:hypothetical protein
MRNRLMIRIAKLMGCTPNRNEKYSGAKTAAHNAARDE